MNIRELCYELYKEDWKVLHDITGEAEQRYLIDYYLDLYDYSKYSYKDYIEEYGYDGKLYVCYDEFLDNEYMEEDYILSLLQNKTLQEEYLKDIKGMDLTNDFKNRCADCACLVSENGMWYCDEAQDYCSSIKVCPEEADNYEI